MYNPIHRRSEVVDITEGVEKVCKRSIMSEKCIEINVCVKDCSKTVLFEIWKCIEKSEKNHYLAQEKKVLLNVSI